MRNMYNRRSFVGIAASAAAVAIARPASPQAGAKPAMRLGLIVSAGRDPEAAIRKVHELGFPTCQVGVSSFAPEMATRLRGALDRFQIEATSLVSGGPGPEIYDFYHGPLT